MGLLVFTTKLLLLLVASTGSLGQDVDAEMPKKSSVTHIIWESDALTESYRRFCNSGGIMVGPGEFADGVNISSIIQSFVSAWTSDSLAETGTLVCRQYGPLLNRISNGRVRPICDTIIHAAGGRTEVDDAFFELMEAIADSSFESPCPVDHVDHIDQVDHVDPFYYDSKKVRYIIERAFASISSNGAGGFCDQATDIIFDHTISSRSILRSVIHSLLQLEIEDVSARCDNNEYDIHEDLPSVFFRYVNDTPDISALCNILTIDSNPEIPQDWPITNISTDIIFRALEDYDACVMLYDALAQFDPFEYDIFTMTGYTSGGSLCEFVTRESQWFYIPYLTHTDGIIDNDDSYWERPVYSGQVSPGVDFHTAASLVVRFIETSSATEGFRMICNRDVTRLSGFLMEICDPIKRYDRGDFWERCHADSVWPPWTYDFPYIEDGDFMNLFFQDLYNLRGLDGAYGTLSLIDFVNELDISTQYWTDTCSAVGNILYTEELDSSRGIIEKLIEMHLSSLYRIAPSFCENRPSYQPQVNGQYTETEMDPWNTVKIGFLRGRIFENILAYASNFSDANEYCENTQQDEYWGREEAAVMEMKDRILESVTMEGCLSLVGVLTAEMSLEDFTIVTGHPNNHSLCSAVSRAFNMSYVNDDEASFYLHWPISHLRSGYNYGYDAGYSHESPEILPQEVTLDSLIQFAGQMYNSDIQDSILMMCESFHDHLGHFERKFCNFLKGDHTIEEFTSCCNYSSCNDIGTHEFFYDPWKVRDTVEDAFAKMSFNGNDRFCDQATNVIFDQSVTSRSILMSIVDTFLQQEIDDVLVRCNNTERDLHEDLSSVFFRYVSNTPNVSELCNFLAIDSTSEMSPGMPIINTSTNVIFRAMEDKDACVMLYYALRQFDLFEQDIFTITGYTSGVSLCEYVTRGSHHDHIPYSPQTDEISYHNESYWERPVQSGQVFPGVDFQRATTLAVSLLNGEPASEGLARICDVFHDVTYMSDTLIEMCDASRWFDGDLFWKRCHADRLWPQWMYDYPHIEDRDFMNLFFQDLYNLRMLTNNETYARLNLFNFVNELDIFNDYWTDTCPVAEYILYTNELDSSRSIIEKLIEMHLGPLYRIAPSFCEERPSHQSRFAEHYNETDVDPWNKVKVGFLRGRIFENILAYASNFSDAKKYCESTQRNDYWQREKEAVMEMKAKILESVTMEGCLSLVSVLTADISLEDFTIITGHPNNHSLCGAVSRAFNISYVNDDEESLYLHWPISQHRSGYHYGYDAGPYFHESLEILPREVTLDSLIRFAGQMYNNDVQDSILMMCESFHDFLGHFERQFCNFLKGNHTIEEFESCCDYSSCNDISTHEYFYDPWKVRHTLEDAFAKMSVNGDDEFCDQATNVIFNQSITSRSILRSIVHTLLQQEIDDVLVRCNSTELDIHEDLSSVFFRYVSNTPNVSELCYFLATDSNSEMPEGMPIINSSTNVIFRAMEDKDACVMLYYALRQFDLFEQDIFMITGYTSGVSLCEYVTRGSHHDHIPYSPQTDDISHHYESYWERPVYSGQVFPGVDFQRATTLVVSLLDGETALGGLTRICNNFYDVIYMSDSLRVMCDATWQADRYNFLERCQADHLWPRWMYDYPHIEDGDFMNIFFRDLYDLRMLTNNETYAGLNLIDFVNELDISNENWTDTCPAVGNILYTEELNSSRGIIEKLIEMHLGPLYRIAPSFCENRPSYQSRFNEHYNGTEMDPWLRVKIGFLRGRILENILAFASNFPDANEYCTSTQQDEYWGREEAAVMEMKDRILESVNMEGCLRLVDVLTAEISLEDFTIITGHPSNQSLCDVVVSAFESSDVNAGDVPFYWPFSHYPEYNYGDDDGYFYESPLPQAVSLDSLIRFAGQMYNSDVQTSILMMCNSFRGHLGSFEHNVCNFLEGDRTRDEFENYCSGRHSSDHSCDGSSNLFENFLSEIGWLPLETTPDIIQEIWGSHLDSHSMCAIDWDPVKGFRTVIRLWIQSILDTDCDSMIQHFTDVLGVLFGFLGEYEDPKHLCLEVHSNANSTEVLNRIEVSMAEKLTQVLEDEQACTTFVGRVDRHVIDTSLGIRTDIGSNSELCDVLSGYISGTLDITFNVTVLIMDIKTMIEEQFEDEINRLVDVLLKIAATAYKKTDIMDIGKTFCRSVFVIADSDLDVSETNSLCDSIDTMNDTCSDLLQYYIPYFWLRVNHIAWDNDENEHEEEWNHGNYFYEGELNHGNYFHEEERDNYEHEWGQNNGTYKHEWAQNNDTYGHEWSQNNGTYEYEWGQNNGTYKHEWGQNNGTYKHEWGQNNDTFGHEWGQNNDTYEYEWGQNNGTYQHEWGQNNGTYKHEWGQNNGTYRHEGEQNYYNYFHEGGQNYYNYEHDGGQIYYNYEDEAESIFRSISLETLPRVLNYAVGVRLINPPVICSGVDQLLNNSTTSDILQSGVRLFAMAVMSQASHICPSEYTRRSPRPPTWSDPMNDETDLEDLVLAVVQFLGDYSEVEPLCWDMQTAFELWEVSGDNHHLDRILMTMESQFMQVIENPATCAALADSVGRRIVSGPIAAWVGFESNEELCAEVVTHMSRGYTGNKTIDYDVIRSIIDDIDGCGYHSPRPFVSELLKLASILYHPESGKVATSVTEMCKVIKILDINGDLPPEVSNFCGNFTKTGDIYTPCRNITDELFEWHVTTFDKAQKTNSSYALEYTTNVIIEIGYALSTMYSDFGFGFKRLESLGRHIQNTFDTGLIDLEEPYAGCSFLRQLITTNHSVLISQAQSAIGYLMSDVIEFSTSLGLCHLSQIGNRYSSEHVAYRTFRDILATLSNMSAGEFCNIHYEGITARTDFRIDGMTVARNAFEILTSQEYCVEIISTVASADRYNLLYNVTGINMTELTGQQDFCRQLTYAFSSTPGGELEELRVGEIPGGWEIFQIPGHLLPNVSVMYIIKVIGAVYNDHTLLDGAGTLCRVVEGFLSEAIDSSSFNVTGLCGMIESGDSLKVERLCLNLTVPDYYRRQYHDGDVIPLSSRLENLGRELYVEFLEPNNPSSVVHPVPTVATITHTVLKLLLAEFLPFAAEICNDRGNKLITQQAAVSGWSSYPESFASVVENSIPRITRMVLATVSEFSTEDACRYVHRGINDITGVVRRDTIEELTEDILAALYDYDICMNTLSKVFDILGEEAGFPNTTAFYNMTGYWSRGDFCGMATERLSPITCSSWVDCFGVCGGPAVEDCYGTCGGLALPDPCRECTGGETYRVPCLEAKIVEEGCKGLTDCNDDCHSPGSTTMAYINKCGTCVEGNTGRHNLTDIDACGICIGETRTCEWCDGILNSGIVEDACGVCGGTGECVAISGTDRRIVRVAEAAEITISGAGFDKTEEYTCFLAGGVNVSSILIPFNRTAGVCTVTLEGAGSYNLSVLSGERPLNVKENASLAILAIAATRVVEVAPALPVVMRSGVNFTLTVTPGSLEMLRRAGITPEVRVARESATGATDQYSKPLPARFDERNVDVLHVSSPPTRSARFVVGLFLPEVGDLLREGFRITFYAPSPKLEALQFSDTGSRIFAAFDSPVDSGGFQSCEDVLVSLSLLGNDSDCAWPTSRGLRITVGTGDNLVTVGDSLVFRRDQLRASNAEFPYPEAEGSVIEMSIAAPEFPPRVEAWIEGPSMVSYCAKSILLTLKTKGAAGRRLLYDWSVVPQLNASLPDIDQRNLRVDAQLLSLGVSYTFSVTLTNFLGASATASTTVTRSSEGIPEVKIIPNDVEIDNVPVSNKFKLVADVSLSSCVLPGRTVFRWSVDLPGINLTTKMDSRQLLVPANTLPGDTDVTFSMVVYKSSAPNTTVGDSITLRTRYSPLRPVIAQGRRITVGHDSGLLRLDASDSNDPNEVDVEEQFQWNCEQIVEGLPSECWSYDPDYLGEFILDIVNSSSPILAFEAAHMNVESRYNFTLTYSKGQRSRSAFIIVKPVAGAPPKVWIKPVSNPVKTSELLTIIAKVGHTMPITKTELSTAGSEEGHGDLDLTNLMINSTERSTGLTYLSMAIAEDHLVPGLTYLFQLNVTTADNRTGQATVTVRVSDLVTSCVATFEGGITSYAELEELIIAVDGCTTGEDAYPLFYQLSMADDTGAFIDLTLPETGDRIPLDGPSAQLRCESGPCNRFIVKVCNSFQVCTELSDLYLDVITRNLSQTEVAEAYQNIIGGQEIIQNYQKALTNLNLLAEVVGENTLSNSIAAATSGRRRRAVDAQSGERHRNTSATNNKRLELLGLEFENSDMTLDQSVLQLNNLIQFDIGSSSLEAKEELVNQMWTIIRFFKSEKSPVPETTAGRLLQFLEDLVEAIPSDVSRALRKNIRNLGGVLRRTLNSGLTLGALGRKIRTGKYREEHRWILPKGKMTFSDDITVFMGSAVENMFGPDRNCTGGPCDGVVVNCRAFNESVDEHSQTEEERNARAAAVLELSFQDPITGGDLNVTDLSDPVSFDMPLTVRPGAGQRARCKFFATASGRWSDVGIETMQQDNDKVSCLTTHFSTFTVLIDDDPTTTLKTTLRSAPTALRQDSTDTSGSMSEGKTTTQETLPTRQKGSPLVVIIIVVVVSLLLLVGGAVVAAIFFMKRSGSNKVTHEEGLGTAAPPAESPAMEMTKPSAPPPNPEPEGASPPPQTTPPTEAPPPEAEPAEAPPTEAEPDEAPAPEAEPAEAPREEASVPAENALAPPSDEPAPSSRSMTPVGD